VIKEIKGDLDGSGLKVGVVMAEFNDMITGQLKRGALDMLEKCGVNKKDVEIYKAPGSFEIPGLARRVVESDKFDGVICLGAVIRGETPHFDYVASEVTRGVGKLSYDSELPVVFGVITADTVEQAVNRAGVKVGNKGADAAQALVRQASVYRELEN